MKKILLLGTDPAEVTRYFYTPVANDILRVPGESL